MLEGRHRDEVFTAGGQPSVTYVEREELHVERNLARALATPNQIVSLSGPTKTGKTVLCKTVLGDKEYVWIDGGQISEAIDLWNSVCSELNVSLVTEHTDEISVGQQGGVNFHFMTASGSRLRKRNSKSVRPASSMTESINKIIEDRIVLVIDDFHYMSAAVRTEVMRNVKGAVFNGMKVLLLSVTHRAFDAIKAEPELTGRFTAITLPNWKTTDLKKIPDQGFKALKVSCPANIIQAFADEAQENPFLMQKFCWELCFDCDIGRAKMLGKHVVPEGYNLREMFQRIAQDAGLPIYQKLVAGPQSRRTRNRRPLRVGDNVDIYQATLLALAETGPKASVSYEELREKLSIILSDMVPQKNEITSALKHLGNLSKKSNSELAIDWDEDKREINLVDPYLRFFLRWQVRSGGVRTPIGG